MRFLIILVSMLAYLLPVEGFAADSPELVSLQKQILKADCKNDIAKPLEELKGIYFKENRYTDFVNFLKSLPAKESCIFIPANYYILLSRYTQLKYLEEKQLWDEYFSEGNNYRDDITASAQKVIDKAEPGSPLLLRCRLILWQFHRDQQDPFAQEALSGLMGAVSGYTGKDPEVIKEVADKLSASGEKADAKQLYRLYADKVITSVSSDEQLKGTAKNFYDEGNLELAENFYDLYIEKVSKTLPKEKSCFFAAEIMEIAALFTYKDSGLKDPLYAEKMFQEAQDLCSAGVFKEDLQYARAINLEKAKELIKAKDAYVELLKRYPGSTFINEANFKVGVISVYILRGISSGKSYFNKLADKKEIDPYVISGLYQLGLLAQWQDDTESAKNYYSKLITLAGMDYQDITAMAKARLAEIENKKPIEYNLKNFLDLSLKDENSFLDMAKSTLTASRYFINKNNETQITCAVNMPASGCMQPEVQYLWSGDTGTTLPQDSQSGFSTTYPSAGTKVLNLIIVLPSGFFDRNIDFVDVK